MNDGDWLEYRRLVLADLARAEATGQQLSTLIEALRQELVVITEKVSHVDALTARVSQLETDVHKMAGRVAVLGATAGGVGLSVFEILKAWIQ